MIDIFQKGKDYVTEFISKGEWPQGHDHLCVRAVAVCILYERPPGPLKYNNSNMDLHVDL